MFQRTAEIVVGTMNSSVVFWGHKDVWVIFIDDLEEVNSAYS